jgi:hypothetical protein
MPPNPEIAPCSSALADESVPNNANLILDDPEFRTRIRLLMMRVDLLSWLADASAG